MATDAHRDGDEGDIHLNCPACGTPMIITSAHRIPELPSALAFHDGCKRCHKPFVLARMPEGVRAFQYTRNGDIVTGVAPAKASA